VRFDLQPEDMKPIVKLVVAEVAEQAQQVFAGVGSDEIAIDEAEAARRLSVPRHVLRDCRLRTCLQIA
jgi:hypothetical protein